MTAKGKQRSSRTRPTSMDAVQDATKYGIDVSAIRDNLAVTPAERLRRHEIALNTVEMLRKAKRA